MVGPIHNFTTKIVCVTAETTQLAEWQLKEVANALKEVSEWYQLGLQLGLTASKLKTIESNHPHDAERCKSEVLLWWLQNATERSWKKIAEALDKMEYKVLAEELEKKMFQG